MAGIRAVAQTADVATGTSAKTILQIVAAANHRVIVREFSISFDGTSNTGTPIHVALIQQSTAGTGGDALTCVKIDESTDETLQTTALKDIDEAEPTGSTVLMAEKIHPQGGFTWQAPQGGELLVKGGTRLGVVVTADYEVNALARIVFEE
jgi:hypothetical protein